ncbi:MAG: phosphomethylpyrimidine synthase, partial [Rickettsiales bacterium]
MIDNKYLTLGGLPASTKTYVQSDRFADVKVAMRRIKLAENSENPHFDVYDTSGIYTDNEVCDKIDLNKGLPKLREAWIRERGDVEEYTGRDVLPEDNGIFVKGAKSSVPEFDLSEFKPVRAKEGKKPTQIEYARAGIITKEMEYVTVRE